jgi:iron complex outermembrane receptor protein
MAAHCRRAIWIVLLILAPAPAALGQVSPPVLPPVVVEEPRLTPEEAAEAERLRYTAPDETTATKTDTPVMETPMAVQVVPRQVIDDQGAVKAKDIFRNISGAQQGFDFGDNSDSLILRGFPATNLRNGLFGNEFQTAVDSSHTAATRSRTAARRT